MKDSRNPLASAIRYALGAGLIAGLAATAAPVVAQDQDQNGEEAVDLDRVQITGSRIRRTDFENTSPITVIDREEILSSGLGNIGDVLRNLSQADSLGLSNLTSATNANDGTQTVSLRGLGATRTLVLVDGRRWLSLGGGQVDLTQIPNAIIERVEVLADGASAIYGSDAIGGVINIILRDDFQGMELDTYYGENEEGDGELRQYGVSFGHNGDRGSLFFNINKVEQEAISAGDREISRFPTAFVPVFAGSTFTPFGRFFTFADVGNNVALDPNFDQSSGQPTADDFIPWDDLQRFNFAPTNFLLTPSDRLTAFVRGTYDLTDSLPFFDDIQFFSNFTYNQRESVTQIAAVPIGTSIFGFGPQWNITISEDNVFNPFGNEVVGFGFRMPNPRRNIQDFDTYFGTLGFEGSQSFGDRFIDWDVSYSRGTSSRTETGENFVNLLRLQQGLGPSFLDPDSGLPVCGTPDNPTPFLNGRSCVPLNFFNGHTGLTQDMLDFVNQTLVQRSESGMREWQFNASTELFDMPAGGVGLAVGYERRTNQFRDDPDSTIVAGLNSTNFREPTNGEQQAEEFFFELAVPLLADLPAVEYLELTAAGRFSDFTNEGFVGNDFFSESFDNESFKLGLLYRPFSDLLFRANYTETFRAPSVTNLFAGGGEGFPQASDLCNTGIFPTLTPEQQQGCLDAGVPDGGAQQPSGQIRQLAGGNPTLQPEEGDTTTIGFVYNPSWLDGLDISVDYWAVELEDAIVGRGITAIINSCIEDLEQEDCDRITRNPAQGGAIDTVRVTSGNLASIRIRGYDGNINYQFNTENFGSFRFGLNATYTSTAQLVIGPISEAESVVGQFVGAFGGPTWRWRGNGSIDWNFGNWSVTWGVRYLHSLEEDCGNTRGFRNEDLFDLGVATRQLCSNPNLDSDEVATNTLGSATYHDISASYEVPWNGTIRAGIRNVFDRDPPFSTQSFANSFDQAYDIPGAFWWLSYQQRF